MWFETDVSEVPIFPYSGIMMPKKRKILTLEDGTDR
jgi:hypothetical protein